MRKIILLMTMFLCHTSITLAQYAKVILVDAIDQVSKKWDVNITYNKNLLEGYQTQDNWEDTSCFNELRKIFYGSGFSFIEYNSSIYIIKSDTFSEDYANLIEVNGTKHNDSFQNDFNKLLKYTIRGIVIDGKKNEVLAGISIWDAQTQSGTITSYDGSYSIELPLGKHFISYSGVGFEKVDIDLNLQVDITKDIDLFEESLLIDEIVITGTEFADNISNSQSGIEVVKIEALRSIPAFMGEVDVVRSITALPGVSSVGEGASGFNVRGGSSDQNLILMDGIPIYNSSHLFGFFSVFNPDVLDRFTLYKGGTPAQFGGRASSVLNVTTRNGNLEQMNIAGNLGIISSKLNIESPIVKEKSSILFSTRLAYPTWLAKYIPDDDIKKSKASFQDVNLKVFSKLTDGSKLTSSSYFGQDTFKFARDTTYSWLSFGSSLELNKNWDNKTLSLAGVFSKFENSIEGSSRQEEYYYSTFMSLAGIKVNIEFFENEKDDSYQVGVEANYLNNNGGVIEPTSEESVINHLGVEEDHAIETALHLSATKSFGSWNVSGGVRYSYYTNVGSAQEYVYANPELPKKNEAIDSVIYSSGKLFGDNNGFEPRLNVNYKLNDRNSIKLGYQRMRQNMHIISNSVSLAPTDYWKLAGQYIKPVISDQINLGYYSNLRMYMISTELFYKEMNNLVEYRNGALLFLNKSLETDLIAAQGRSYGLELKMEKRGKVNGWLSYTYSRTWKKIEPIESYNSVFSSGFYPAEYDKPHNLNVYVNYKIKRRVGVSANFVFSSGRPITAPNSAYHINKQLIVDYSDRNNVRIPNYHRLDISITWDTNLKKDKRFEGNWAFSVYNVYGRRNPFSIYFDTIGEGRYPQAYQLSILGSAFPSISYNFKIQ